MITEKKIIIGQNYTPGNFFVRKDAFVIIDFDKDVAALMLVFATETRIPGAFSDWSETKISE